MERAEIYVGRSIFDMRKVEWYQISFDNHVKTTYLVCSDSDHMDKCRKNIGGGFFIRYFREYGIEDFNLVNGRIWQGDKLQKIEELESETLRLIEESIKEVLQR